MSFSNEEPSESSDPSSDDDGDGPAKKKSKKALRLMDSTGADLDQSHPASLAFNHKFPGCAKAHKAYERTNKELKCFVDVASLPVNDKINILLRDQRKCNLLIICTFQFVILYLTYLFFSPQIESHKIIITYFNKFLFSVSSQSCSQSEVHEEDAREDEEDN